MNPEYVERLRRMLDTALEITGGDEDRAILLVSKTAENLAVGGWQRRGNRQAVVREALGLAGAR